MRVDTALLCDAATAREGLLNILGGGITNLEREDFPAPLGVTLALRIVFHPTELGDKDHQIEILLLDEDGAQVTRAEINVESNTSGDIPPGAEPSIPIPWDFPAQPKIPHPGRYSLEVLIDGAHQKTVPFTATQVQGGNNE